MSNSPGFRNSASSTSSSTSSSPGRGRGRGYGVNPGPLKKPESRNVDRPGSTTGTPKSNDSDQDSRSSVAVANVHANVNDPATHDNLLRSPSSSSSASISGSTAGQSAKASLDVSAAAFVPIKQHSQTSLCPLAKEFVPSYSQQPACTANYAPLNVFIDNTLTNFLHNPSSYQRSIDGVVSHLTSSLQSIEAMTTACNAIFNWALTENSMSYMCAKLCEDISGRVQNDHNGRFHQHMLKRCREEHVDVKNLIRNDVKRLCSFAVFLAELYTKDVFQINKVRDALFELLELMVENLDNELARPIGQILKMSGAKLEDDLAKTGETKRMERLLTAVGTKLSNSEGIQLNRSMSELLKSVLTLRAANWGRTVSPQASVPSSPAVPANYSQDPIFYDREGRPITREQAGYGEENVTWFENGEMFEYSGGAMDGGYAEVPGASGDFTGIEEGDDDPDFDVDILVMDDDDEEMTAEMWEAYDRFQAERDQNLRSMYEDSGQ